MAAMMQQREEQSGVADTASVEETRALTLNLTLMLTGSDAVISSAGK